MAHDTIPSPPPVEETADTDRVSDYPEAQHSLDVLESYLALVRVRNGAINLGD